MTYLQGLAAHLGVCDSLAADQAQYWSEISPGEPALFEAALRGSRPSPLKVALEYSACRSMWLQVGPLITPQHAAPHRLAQPCPQGTDAADVSSGTVAGSAQDRCEREDMNHRLWQEVRSLGRRSNSRFDSYMLLQGGRKSTLQEGRKRSCS
jgi:hypothetical protein